VTGFPGGSDEAMIVAEFHAVCRVEEIVEGRAKGVEIDGLRIAVFRHEEGVFALLGRCPHANGPMSLGWIEEGEAVCPLHRWRFKLATGRCTTVRGESLHRFDCEVRDGVIWVKA
jgi:nitrite reductase/ring-hydroxylating ferredoxin subunit